MTEDSAIRRLLDEAGVRDATARFAHAATYGDLEAFRELWTDDAVFRELWTDDAVWKIGDHVDASGVDEIAETFGQLRNGREFFVQFAVQGPIVVSGDLATTSTICHEQARGPGESYYRNHCVTEDQLVREADGTWSFTARTYRYLWLDTSPFGGDSFPLTAP